MLEDADAILVLSPVYFGILSGQLKCMFDRTLMLRRKDFALKGKVGAAGAVGRSRNGGQEHTISTIHTWMHIHGMIVVGDGNHFGATAQDPYSEDDIGKETLHSTVDKLCEVCKAVHA